LLVSRLQKPAALSRPRRVIGLARIAAAALSVFIAACADGPSSPDRLATPGAQPQRSTATSGNGLLTRAQGLLRTTPLEKNVVVVKTLSHGGGGITVPGTDFQLQVPNGAFEGKSMTFTITAYAGNVVAYDFEPHGVVFLKPLKAVQQLGHTNWKSFQLPAGYYADWAGAYFADPNQLNTQTGRAFINEFIPGGVSVGGATMTWNIPHFSGYMVSTGREAPDQY
jgi:hypothetical protein